MGRYALLVGVGEAKSGRLPSLGAPRHDLAALETVLAAKDIGAFDTVLVLADEEVDFGSLRDRSHWLFEDRRPEDVVLFYYSGHGIKPYAGDLHLALPGTDPKRIATAYPSSLLRDCLRDTGAGVKLVVLDCCHSGAFFDGAKALQPAPAVTPEAFPKDARGQFVLTACRDAEYAFDAPHDAGDGVRNSVFTRFLVEGLKGEAARPGEPFITFDGLADYLGDAVPRADARMRPQRLALGDTRDVPLVRNRRYAPPLPAPVREAAVGEDWRQRLVAVFELKALLLADDQAVRAAARDLLARMRARPDERRDIHEEIGRALEGGPAVAAAPPPPQSLHGAGPDLRSFAPPRPPTSPAAPREEPAPKPRPAASRRPPSEPARPKPTTSKPASKAAAETAEDEATAKRLRLALHSTSPVILLLILGTGGGPLGGLVGSMVLMGKAGWWAVLRTGIASDRPTLRRQLAWTMLYDFLALALSPILLDMGF